LRETLTWVPLAAFAVLWAALVHHGYLALRYSRARKSSGEPPRATHSRLVGVEFLSGAIVVLLLLSRWAMHRPLPLGLFWSYFLYFLLVTTVVYWFYPDAMPIPTERELGPKRGWLLLGRGMRYFLAVFGSLMSLVMALIVLLADA